MSDKSARAQVAVGHNDTSCAARFGLRLDGGGVALRQTQFTGLEQAPHDLSAASVRQRVDELDLLRRDGGAKPLAGVAEDSGRSSSSAVQPVLESDERFHHLADGGIRFADHRRLGHRRMIGQRVFHLERPDEMPGGLDHVVRSADEPEVAVGVALYEISGQVHAVREALAVSVLLCR